MSYNLLQDANLNNTTSGIAYTQCVLSQTELRNLVSGELIAVSSGTYVGIKADLGMDMLCNEFRVYLSETISGTIIFRYKEFLMNQWVSDGAYNYNTNYCTPVMYSDDYPEPYSCEASAYDSGQGAYKAFDQSEEQYSCWTSITGSLPKSIMFHFPFPKVINKYALQRTYWTYFPTSFVFQGNTVDIPSVSDDGHWETLDSRSGVSLPSSRYDWTSFYTFSNSKAYNYYRIKITASNYSNYVYLENVKLVEANRQESVPQSVWYTGALEWTGSYYSCSLDSAAGVEELELFIGTSRDTTISGVELIASTEYISTSGIVASGIYTDLFRLTNLTLDPLVIDIRNQTTGNASPKVMFDYTGNYDVDRNIFISPDYPTVYDKDAAVWRGIDYGWSLPETDSFERGIFIAAKVDQKNIILIDDTTTSGCWLSPVIDTNNELAPVYIYGQGNFNVYIRSSDTPPPEVRFLITTTDPTHQWLMYDHKRIYIDSSGSIIGSTECGGSETGNKVWRIADSSYAGSYLMYYGGINNRGTAAVVFPGYLDCGNVSPEEEYSDYSYWYQMNKCYMGDDTLWSGGTTISGLPYGENISVVFSKVFPVDGSDGFFCFLFISDTDKITTNVYLTFVDTYTRGAFPIHRYSGLVLPDDRVDVAYDQANNNWWVYINPNLYKIDLGSINNTRIFGTYDPTTNTNLPDTFEGYIWTKEISETWKGIISIPSNDFNYFWTFSEDIIYLYEEKYMAEEPEVLLLYSVDMGVQLEASFDELHCGSCDAEGNLWMLDIGQERVFRVNLKKALLNSSSAVDYENQIPGALGLWAHPTDGTCYILISDEPEHSEQDIIRMVHANQRWGSQGKYVCSVGGFYSKPYMYGVTFTGRAFEQSVRPHDDDFVWGVNGNLDWQAYEIGKNPPRGRYQQVKIDLLRTSLSESSPRVQRIRAPSPISLSPLSKNEKTSIALKTTFNKVSSYGNWDTKINIWWFDEEV